MMKQENCLLKLGIKRTMQKKSTSTDFLPLNLNNEKVLTTSQALNLLKQRGYFIKDDPLSVS